MYKIIKKLAFHLFSGKNFSIFWVVFGFIFFIKIITLSYNPLAWFDEVIFASMSQDFWRNGTFFSPITIFGEQEEVKIYGFFYFLYAGFLPYLCQEVLGFIPSPFYFRVGNLVSGAFFLALFYKIMRIYLQLPKKYTLFITLLLAIDPFFNLCWHEARMDITSVLFAYLCLYVAYKYFVFSTFTFSLTNFSSFGVWDKNYFLATLFLVLGVWTTPRIGLVFFGFGIVGFMLGFPKRVFWVKICFFAMMGYSVWIFWKFDGFLDFIHYYTKGGNLAHQDAFQTHYLGGRGYIPKHEYLIILTTILYLGVYFCVFSYHFLYPQNNKIVWLSNNPKAFLLSASFINITLFYLVVFDYGQYSIYILGFYYILLGYFGYYFHEFFYKKAKQKYFFLHYAWILGVLFGFNAFFFVGKTLQSLADISRRNPAKIHDFIHKNIPQNARMIGDATYYYALQNAKNSQKNIKFQLIDNYETPENRELIQRQKFQYTHILITEMLKKKRPELITYYQKQAQKAGKNWRKIAYLHEKPSDLYLNITQFFRLSQMETPAYNVEIWEMY